MSSLPTIVRFLNQILNTRSISDTSRNGLQVKGVKGIRKIGFAVDACLSTFQKAKKLGVDLLIVHHGLYWKGQRDKTGVVRDRVRFLKKNKMSLYASHLPLDLHEKYGNNIELARLLDLREIKKFGKYHGMAIGFQGRFFKAVSLRSVARKLDKKIGSKSLLFLFGRKKIRTIGIVSGGGASALVEAYKKRLDCFITGEAPHHVYHEAKDRRQNVILAGHYETETVGVKALMPLLRKKFGVKTVFVKNRTMI